MPQISLITDITRRHALTALGSLVVAGCGGDSSSSASSSSNSSSSSSSSSTGSQTCGVIAPDETVGPYPILDTVESGSNSSGTTFVSTFVRSDITEGKSGLPFELTLTIVQDEQCSPLADADVYIWHCDADGEYSGVSNSTNGNHTGETWLRGIQTTDANGQVTFSSIFPGWYSGRLTHIHFRVYKGNQTWTSQIAFDFNIVNSVYTNSAAYIANGLNSMQTPESDSGGVFNNDDNGNGQLDYYDELLDTCAGDTTNGYVATKVVRISDVN